MRFPLAAWLSAAVLAIPGAAAAGEVRDRPDLRLFFEAGAELIDTHGFSIFEPGLEYRGDRLTVALGGPLRIGTATDDGGWHLALRRADVDEFSDLGGMLRLVEVGREGERFRLLAGSLPSFTLGNGAIVGGLRPALDPDHPRAGALAQGRVGPVFVEGLASDLLSARVFAGRTGLLLGERWTLGAPAAIEPEPVAGADPVSVVGAEASAAVVRGEAVALVPYAEAAGIATAGGGAGLHLGLAADLRLGPGGDTWIGLRGEWRGMGRGYLPAYFDEFHEVERWAYPRTTSAPKHLRARDLPAGQGFALETRLDFPAGVGVQASLDGRQGGPWGSAIGADLQATPGWTLGFLLARRGAAGPRELFAGGAETWAMAESRWALGGPVYGFGTLAHGLRVVRGEAEPREYTAGSVGFGLALAP